MNQKQTIQLAAGLVLICGFLFLAAIIISGLRRMAAPSGFPTSDLLSTLEAITPGTYQPTEFSTPIDSSTQATSGESTGEPSGKIVFTCQLFKVQASNQICIMNADGTGFRRLTTDGTRQHRYASIASGGKSILYAAFREANVYELYELDLTTGTVKQLTDRIGILSAPEISPDGSTIVFTKGIPNTDKNEIWVMYRDGSDPMRVFEANNATAGTWDPTWSPDGSEILFASNMGGPNQLWRIKLDGSDLKKVSSLPALRGRSDWSVQNLIVTYSGEAWGRELYVMNPDGSNQHQISPEGGNSQGPSFSPDGEWAAFTAYFDHFNDIHGCEIYILRVDGSDLRRLTSNDYCDYQPRWGP